MFADSKIQDLAIANIDQLLDVKGIQGGRRKYSFWSYSASFNSCTSCYRRVSGRPDTGTGGGVFPPYGCG